MLAEWVAVHYADDSKSDSLPVAVTTPVAAADVVVAALYVESDAVSLAPDVECTDSVQTEWVPQHSFEESIPEIASTTTLEFAIVFDSVPSAPTITKYSAFANSQWVEPAECESMTLSLAATDSVATHYVSSD